MVLVNKAINEVTVKLVYYGPGLCGKTTNLEKIYSNPKLENKGKMISMSTETDRTLFFDFMPMELGTIAGQKVRVQLYTVPGQVFYDATRKLVLRGADGVVFVADSQPSMRDSNIQSLENLKTNLRLNRIDPDKVAEMTDYLRPGKAPVVEAAAIEGKGVSATLRAAVGRILENLKNNVDASLREAPPLEAPDLSTRAGVAPASVGSPKPSPRSGAAASPFDAASAQAVLNDVVEELPFDSVEVLAEPDDVDPFGTEASSESPDLAALLTSAQQVVSSLEQALARAKEHERAIAAKLKGQR